MLDPLFVFIYETLGYHEIVEDNMMTQEDLDFLKDFDWFGE
jgi:hypothetical protein